MANEAKLAVVEPEKSKLVLQAAPYQAWIRKEDGNSVALVTSERHAHLFAAAEEMLASLHEIVAEWGCPNTPMWHRARAAIAHAEGRP
jgi:hypothetical protein